MKPKDMKTVFKLIVSIALSLAVSSLLASVSNTISVYGAAVYIFLVLLLYHWWVYVPSVGIHFVCFRYAGHPTWWTSMLLGGFAAAITTLLVVSGADPLIDTPVETNKLVTALNFGAGGGLYGLLYYFWVDKPPHTRLWQK